MFIQTQDTPNPLTLKFIPDEQVMEGTQTIHFNSKEEATNSPLAQALFDLDHITAVFLNPEFISVTKSEDGNWDIVKTEILTTMMDHFVANKPVLLEDKNSTTNESTEDDDDIVKQIKEIIEHNVRPAVAQDGGDIIYKDFEDGIVKLELHGACSGCPSSTITLKNGIENMLKHYVPEVIAVEAVNGPDA